MLVIASTKDLFALTHFFKSQLGLPHAQAQQDVAWVLGMVNYAHACAIVKQKPCIVATLKGVLTRMVQLCHVRGVACDIDTLTAGFYAFRGTPESRDICVQHRPLQAIEGGFGMLSEDDPGYCERRDALIAQYNTSDPLQRTRSGLANAAADVASNKGFSLLDPAGVERHECTHFFDRFVFDGISYAAVMVLIPENDDPFLRRDLAISSIGFQCCRETPDGWVDFVNAATLGEYELTLSEAMIPRRVTEWAVKRLRLGNKHIAPYIGRLIIR